MAIITIPPVVKLGEHEKDVCCFNGTGPICFDPPCGLPAQFVAWTCEGSTDGCAGAEHTRWSEFTAFDCDGSGDTCANHTRQAEYDANTAEGEIPGGDTFGGAIVRVNSGGYIDDTDIRVVAAQLSCCPRQIKTTFRYTNWGEGNGQPIGERTDERFYFGALSLHYRSVSQLWIPMRPSTILVGNWAWELLDWTIEFHASACTNAVQIKGGVVYTPAP